MRIVHSRGERGSGLSGRLKNRVFKSLKMKSWEYRPCEDRRSEGGSFAEVMIQMIICEDF